MVQALKARNTELACSMGQFYVAPSALRRLPEGYLGRCPRLLHCAPLVLVKTPAGLIKGRLTVFNVGGNKVRIVAAIHYNRRRIYIRAVLTHEEYDKGKWKE